MPVSLLIWSNLQSFSNNELTANSSIDLSLLYNRTSGPGCSKLTTSLVKVLLKFQIVIAQSCQYFLLKKCETLLQCKSFSHFVNKKYQCIWL